MSREADRLDFYVDPWSDQDNHIGYPSRPGLVPPFDPGYDSFDLTLSLDGETIAEDFSPYLDAYVPPGPHEYEATLDASRDVDFWLHSTHTVTTWRFFSDTTAAPSQVPLVKVDYDIDLDGNNGTDAPNPIAFHAYGVPGSPEITDFSASWSIDDGKTWTPLSLTDLGGGAYDATVPVPASCDPACFVSLRVAAEGEDGSSVKQDVIRAYTARFVATTPTSPPPTTSTPTSTPTGTAPGSTSPTPTSTDPVSPTVGPTSLPGTGGGRVGLLAGLGLLILLAGAIVTVLARRRLDQVPDRRGL